MYRHWTSSIKKNQDFEKNGFWVYLKIPKLRNWINSVPIQGKNRGEHVLGEVHCAFMLSTNFGEKTTNLILVFRLNYFTQNFYCSTGNIVFLPPNFVSKLTMTEVGQSTQHWDLIDLPTGSETAWCDDLLQGSTIRIHQYYFK